MQELRVMKGGSVIATVKDLNDFVMYVAGEIEMEAGLEEEYTLHPKDLMSATKLALGLEMDRRIEDAGVSLRQQRVYTSNLTLLNTYLIARLIKAGEEKWGADTPPSISELVHIADLVIANQENDTTIYNRLGIINIVEKSLQYGDVAGSSYVNVMAEQTSGE